MFCCVIWVRYQSDLAGKYRHRQESQINSCIYCAPLILSCYVWWFLLVCFSSFKAGCCYSRHFQFRCCFNTVPTSRRPLSLRNGWRFLRSASTCCCLVTQEEDGASSAVHQPLCSSSCEALLVPANKSSTRHVRMCRKLQEFQSDHFPLCHMGRII